MRPSASSANAAATRESVEERRGTLQLHPLSTCAGALEGAPAVPVLPPLAAELPDVAPFDAPPVSAVPPVSDVPPVSGTPPGAVCVPPVPPGDGCVADLPPVAEACVPALPPLVAVPPTLAPLLPPSAALVP